MRKIVKSWTFSDVLYSFILADVYKGIEINIGSQNLFLNKEELKVLIGDFYSENDFEYMGSFGVSSELKKLLGEAIDIF